MGNKPLFFAPLEGINNHIYRNAFCRHYSGVDRFYTPFIDINDDGGMKQRNRKDILPENNEGIRLIPQVLTGNPKALALVSEKISALGYDEINLNLGCPSPTVTKKGKGAGMLEDPSRLTAFLEEAYSGLKTKLSVKLRIGVRDPDEWEGIMECLNGFPLTELIIHPRLMSEGYHGQIHEDIFRKMYLVSKIPVCVNPGIRTPQDFAYWEETYPDVTGIMTGRALVADPSLGERIKTEMRNKEKSGKETDKAVSSLQEALSDNKTDRFFTFHDDLLQSYMRVLSGETPVLFKMKELWMFWVQTVPVNEKLRKKISKARKISEYEALVREIRSEQR